MSVGHIAAGVHAMAADVYHADPCEAPSLSSSIIKRICHESPLHAKTAHPRLTPLAGSDEADHFDIGTVAHALLLEGRDCLAIIDAENWRTKAAKEARDAARAEGKTPLLAARWAEVQQMVTATHAQLETHREASNMFTDGHAEQTLIWQDDSGLWGRARPDWLRTNCSVIDDYKTTSASANPDVISRTLFANGWDIQAAWYLRGLKVLTGLDATFRFCVQETFPPYALSVIALGPDVLTLAHKKILYALETWEQCLSRDEWPAYPTRVCHATLPAWEEARWIAKELA